MILCAVGVVATLFSGWIVEVPYLGRRGSLAISLGELLIRHAHGALRDRPPNAVSTGAFLLASTVSKTSNQLLGWNCGYTFCSNVRSRGRCVGLQSLTPIWTGGARRALCHHCRDISRKGPWHGERLDGHCDLRDRRHGTLSLVRLAGNGTGR